MKKRFCAILFIFILLLSNFSVGETTMQFLNTPATKEVVNMIASTGMTAKDCCDESSGLRAILAVGLTYQLLQKEGFASWDVDVATNYVGYSEDLFYAVMALSSTQRAILELDTKYHICNYRLEEDTDTSKNEMVCQELCEENYWPLNVKEIQSALYQILN